jgi:hypothetical protein
VEQNKKSTDGLVEKIAILSDAVENLFPQGKGIIVFELKKYDFLNVQQKFGIKSDDPNKFKIDISGTEIIFLLDELLNDETSKT